MASTKEYLDFVLDRLSVLDGVSYRAMMGEYLVYYKGKVVGGVYDDRFLVKNVKETAEMIPDVKLAEPYEGAAKMILIDNVEDDEFLAKLVEATYEGLPEPKKRRGGRQRTKNESN